MVQVADMMAAKLGASLHPDPQLSLIGTSASSMLRLDDIKVANMLVDVEDDMQTTQGCSIEARRAEPKSGLRQTEIPR